MKSMELMMEQHLNQIKVMDSMVQAILSLMSKDDQKKWFVQHTLQCAEKGIDPVTGSRVSHDNRMADAAKAMVEADKFDDEGDY